MADQVLRYRIELDDSDLSQQLESIRSKINSEVSSAAISAGAPVSIANDSDNPIFAAPMPDMPVYGPSAGAMASIQTPIGALGTFDYTGGQYTSPFPDLQSPGPIADAQSQAILSSAGFAALGSNISSGFSAFLNDAKSVGTNVGNAIAAPFNQDLGVINNFIGAAGFGYDQRMPLSMTDYKSLNQQFAYDAIKDVAPDALSMGVDAGLWAATAATGGNPVLGAIATAKTIFDVATYPLIAPYDDLKDVTKGLQVIGMQQFGAFSKQEAKDLAYQMKDFAQSDEGYLYDYTMSDLESVVSSFAAQGGFKNTQNTDQMKQKMQDLMENFRQVMHILGTTQEEAASIMGELERRQMVTTASAPTFMSEMAVKGMYAGMTGAQVIDFGLSVADQFRGTGYGQMNAFNMGIDAATEVNRLANSMDPYYRQNIFELGGSQSAIQKAIENVAGVMSRTPMGFQMGAGSNAYGPGFLAGDPITQMSQLSGLLGSDPAAYFAAKGQGQGLFSGLNFKTQTMGMISNLYQMAAMFPEFIDDKGNINESVFLGFGQSILANQGMNMPIEQLRELLNIARTGTKTSRSYMEAQQDIKEFSSLVDSKDYSFGDALLYTFSPIGKMMDSAGRWLSEKKDKVGLYVADSFRSVADATVGQTRINPSEYKISQDLFRQYMSDDSLLERRRGGTYDPFFEDSKSELENFKKDLKLNNKEAADTLNGLTYSSQQEYRRYAESGADQVSLHKLLDYLKDNTYKDKKTGETKVKRSEKDIDEDMHYWQDSKETATDSSSVDSLLTEMKKTILGKHEKGTLRLPEDKSASLEELAGMISLQASSAINSRDKKVAARELMQDNDIQDLLSSLGYESQKIAKLNLQVGKIGKSTTAKEKLESGDAAYSNKEKEFQTYLREKTSYGKLADNMGVIDTLIDKYGSTDMLEEAISVNTQGDNWVKTLTGWAIGGLPWTNVESSTLFGKSKHQRTKDAEDKVLNVGQTTGQKQARKYSGLEDKFDSYVSLQTSANYDGDSEYSKIVENLNKEDAKKELLAAGDDAQKILDVAARHSLYDNKGNPIFKNVEGMSETQVQKVVRALTVSDALNNDHRYNFGQNIIDYEQNQRSIRHLATGTVTTEDRSDLKKINDKVSAAITNNVTLTGTSRDILKKFSGTIDDVINGKFTEQSEFISPKKAFEEEIEKTQRWIDTASNDTDRRKARAHLTDMQRDQAALSPLFEQMEYAEEKALDQKISHTPYLQTLERSLLTKSEAEHWTSEQFRDRLSVLKKGIVASVYSGSSLAARLDQSDVNQYINEHSELQAIKDEKERNKLARGLLSQDAQARDEMRNLSISKIISDGTKEGASKEAIQKYQDYTRTLEKQDPEKARMSQLLTKIDGVIDGSTIKVKVIT